MNSDNFLAIFTKSASRKIPLRDILYIKRENKLNAIRTVDGAFYAYGLMNTYENLLDDRFHRARKNLIVNVENIKSADNQTLTFNNNDTLTLGRQAYSTIKKVFDSYLREEISRRLEGNE